MPPEGVGQDGTTADPLAEAASAAPTHADATHADATHADATPGDATLAEATREVAEIAGRLPDGHSRVFHEHRPYALTVERLAGGRSLKLYAEALDGRDVISANLYRGTARVHVRPCEMSMEKVRRFLVGMRPVETGNEAPSSDTSPDTPAGDQGAAPAPISGKA